MTFRYRYMVSRLVSYCSVANNRVPLRDVADTLYLNPLGRVHGVDHLAVSEVSSNVSTAVHHNEVAGKHLTIGDGTQAVHLGIGVSRNRETQVRRQVLRQS